MQDQKHDTHAHDKQSLTQPNRDRNHTPDLRYELVLSQPERTLLTYLGRNQTMGLRQAIELFKSEYSFKGDGTVVIGTDGSPIRKEWADSSVTILARVNEIVAETSTPSWQMPGYEGRFRAVKADTKAEKTEEVAA